jgi:hypothetical protein
MQRLAKANAFVLTLTAGVSGLSNAYAEDMTAGVVMEKMEPADRFTFMVGVIEGLANARYVQDGKDPKGRACIYNWFHADAKKAMGKLEEAMRRYPDAMPGQIAASLTGRACPA